MVSADATGRHVCGGTVAQPNTVWQRMPCKANPGRGHTVADVVMKRDDLNGALGATRRVFSDQGKYYEIDLTPANHAELDALLAGYKDAAREIPNPYVDPDVFHDYKRPTDSDLRNWAHDMGLDNVPSGGRIHGSIVEAHMHYSVLGQSHRLDDLRRNPKFCSQPAYEIDGSGVMDVTSGTAVKKSPSRKGDKVRRLSPESSEAS